MTNDLTLAFLTGQSDRKGCALSPAQRRFLDLLAGERRQILPTNFPYNETPAFRDTGLLEASLNNCRLFLGSQRSSFSRHYQPLLRGVIERAAHTVFLAGSCGLELFNNLHLPPAIERRCTLICYGPVAIRPPSHASAFYVQGKADAFSRFAFPHAAVSVPGNHLDYLDQPEFLTLCQRIISEILQSPCSNTST